MKSRTIWFVGLGIVSAIVLLLTWERIALCTTYWRLAANPTWREQIHRLPQFETIVRHDETSSDTLSLGYADLSGFAENVTRVSAERFPKVTMELQSIRLTFAPPGKYGMEKYERWLQSRQTESAKRVRKVEREWALAGATVPYDQAKRAAMVVPLPLLRVATLPKRRLRMFVFLLERKRFPPDKTIFFEDGPIKAVYAAYKKEFAALSIYDTDLQFTQWVIISLGSEAERLDAARQIVSSLRFTVKTLPGQGDELPRIMREAMEKMPAYDPNSWSMTPVEGHSDVQGETTDKPVHPARPRS